MAKTIRLSLVLAALSVAVLLPSNASATAWSAPYFSIVAAGSSALFNSFSLGLVGYCGPNYYTISSKVNTAGYPQWVDSRNGSIQPEANKTIIAWDNDTQNDLSTTNNTVCVYTSLDSTVGTRLYFGNAVFNIDNYPTTSLVAPSAGIVPFLTGSPATPPLWVQTWLQGQKISLAVSDIRPEDTKFATIRACQTAGTLIPDYYFVGQGYGPCVNTGAHSVGTPIQSAQSTAFLQVVDFAMEPGDVDPYTGAAARGYSEYALGGGPVVVIRNVSVTGSGHFGDGNYNDVNRVSLAQALDGNYYHIRQLSATAGGSEADAPLQVFIREPLSGTYNVMEYNITLSRELYPYNAEFVNLGQETGVNPSNTTNCTVGPCALENGNPYYNTHTNSNGGVYTRSRAIGTGEMVKTVNNTSDGYGYAFWGYANFMFYSSGAWSYYPNLNYSTVDGVDPLFDYPTTRNGQSGAIAGAAYTLPNCSATSYTTPCPLLAFQHIADGSYPIWTVFRVIYDPTSDVNDTGDIVGVVNYLTSNIAATKLTDYIPAYNLKMLHLHFPQMVYDNNTGVEGNNSIANIYATPQASHDGGGEVGGSVVSLQAEADYEADTGNQMTINNLPARI